MFLSTFLMISATLVSVSTQDIISDNKGMKLSPGVEVVSKKILTAKDIKEFGGFSGMIFDNNKKLIIPSDKNGVVLTMHPVFTTNIITGFQNSHLLKLKWDEDKTLSNKLFKKDQEDIAYYNGDCFISLERVNKILFYKQCDFQKQGYNIQIPKALKSLPLNAGMEAFGINNSGNFLTISEPYENDKELHKSYVWKYRNKAYNYIAKDISFFYKSDKYFRISALTFTDDGDLLVLERKSKKPFIHPEMTTKVKLISKNIVSNIKDDSVIAGQELIHIEGYPIVKPGDKDYVLADNFENIAVKEFTKDKLSIFLMSDDNFKSNQKTILLQFIVDKNMLIKNLNLSK